MAGMTSRERVLTTFGFREPDRVPGWCGASPEFWDNAKRKLGLDDEPLRVRLGDDFRRITAIDTEAVDPAPGSTSRTVFGIDRHGVGYGQPTSNPLANATLEEVHAYPWPDARRLDVSKLKAEAEAYGGQYAILGGDWSPFWHDAIDLLGMENMFIKMFDQPEIVDAVMKHTVDYYMAANEKILAAAGSVIDILFIGNDFGSQRGPLVSPDMFRRFVLPQLKRLAEIGRDHHLKVLLHCCGGFEPLIPQFLEIGIDGVHTIQPSCTGMDLRTLKRDYGDKIVLNGAIDSHHVLINGTPESVRESTREVLEIMMPGGGFVAGASHDYILEETPVENVVSMFDAIREFGVYAR